MAFTETTEDIKDAIRNSTSDVPLSSGGAGGVGTSGGFSAPATAPSAGASPTAQAGGGDIGSPLGFSRDGGIRDRLTQPISSSIDSGRTRLGELSTSFYDQAGPSRSYESVGGQGILDGAIDRGQGMDQARGLLGASYQGPQSLGWDAPWSAEDMRARSEALTSGGGLQGLIRGSTNLNQGESRYEAQKLLGDADYRNRAQGAQTSSGAFLDNLTGAQADARSYAAQRTGEEQGIASQAQEYTGQRQEDVMGGVQERVDSRNYDQGAAQRAFDAFRAGPNEASAENAGILDQWRQRQEIAAPRRAATAEATRLEDLYSDISDVPLMDLGITGRGQEHQTFDIGYGPAAYEPAQRGLLEGLWAEPLGSAEDLDRQWTAAGEPGWHDRIDRIGQRQADYAAAFSPVTHANRTQGEHALFNPLYLGESISGSELPTLRDFTQFDPGTVANAENTASLAERGQLTRLSDLLNLGSALGAQQDFREAGTTADIEGFENEWNRILEGRQRSLDSASADWQNQVNAGYEAYRDRREAEQFSTLAGLGSLYMPGAAGTLSAIGNQ